MYEVVRPVYLDEMLHYPAPVGEQPVLLNISEEQAEHLGAAVRKAVVVEAPAKAPKPAAKQ